MENKRIRINDLIKYIFKSNSLVFKWRKWYILLALLFNIILGLLPVVSTLSMQQILNSLQYSRLTFESIRVFIGIYLTAEVLLVLSNYIYSFLVNKNNNLINRSIQLSIVEKAASLRLEDFENADVHNLIMRAQNGANTVTSFLGGFFSIIRVFVSTISSLIILSNYNFLYIFAVSIVPIAEYFFVFKMSQIQYDIRKKRTSKERTIWYLTHIIKTGLSSKELKIFGLSSFWNKRIERLTSEIIEEDLCVAKKSLIGQSIFGVGEVLVGGLIFILIVADGLSGRILVGDVITYNRLIFSVKGNVESIFSIIERMLKDALDVSNYYEFLELESEKNGTLKIDHIESIRFENVSFKYTKNGSPCIKNLSFEILPGETVAFVGSNGSGKSTVLKLILGFYDNYTGDIFISGHNLREIDKHSYLKRTSCLFQDFMKYEETVRENIACSDIAAISNDDRIKNTLLQVGFDFSNTKLFSLNNILGTWFDNSLQISGGEWQRIALGRAFFKVADLYILDEPTSSLDPNSEEIVFTRFCETVHGRIGIISSHNIEKVGDRIERVIVMDDGRIVEDGSPSDLLAMRGQYYHLAQIRKKSC